MTSMLLSAFALADGLLIALLPKLYKEDEPDGPPAYDWIQGP